MFDAALAAHARFWDAPGNLIFPLTADLGEHEVFWAHADRFDADDRSAIRERERHELGLRPRPSGPGALTHNNAPAGPLLAAQRSIRGTSFTPMVPTAR
jgi:hypothetical protein